MATFLWSQLQDIGPSGRAGSAMSYDGQRLITVLFGGFSHEGPARDTWELRGGLWTQLDNMGPSARGGASLAYDEVHQVSLLFGGEGETSVLGDTWVWDGESWTQLENSGPAPRTYHATTFDGQTQTVLLFGGSADAGLTADTWSWDGIGWTQLNDVGPSPRKGHAMTSDPSGGVVLFGGAGSSGEGLADTWRFDGQEWTQVADTGPHGRVGPAMVSVGSTVVLFGGVASVDPGGSNHDVYGDTWRWNGNQWTQVQDIGPAGRWWHSISFEDANNRIVLFGGLDTMKFREDSSFGLALLGDTWVHDVSMANGPHDDSITDDSGGASVEYVSVGGGTLAADGDTVVITFTLDMAQAQPVTVDQSIVRVDETSGVIEFVIGDHIVGASPFSQMVAPGQATNQFVVTRGPDPALPGRYVMNVGVRDQALPVVSVDLPVS